MGKNRLIVTITLGYIIGIIWGLYFKINIVLFYAIVYIFVEVVKLIKKPQRQFKFISIQKILRYIKLILDFKSIIIIILISTISNFIITNFNKKYEYVYSNLEDVTCIAKVIDNGIVEEYKTIYKIKIEKLNSNSKYNRTYLYLNVNNNLKISLKYGDYICVKGSFLQPSKATNYKGFDYSKYLRIQKIYGIIKLKKVEILKENTNSFIFTITNNVFLKIKEIVQSNLPTEKANLLLGILLGYKQELSEELKNAFKESNISHVLAVSGLHVSYIILVITNILEKVQGKRNSKFVVIIFIIVYMFITNFSPSVVRAGMMGIIAIASKLTYNKNDIWTSISISLLISLIYNPYLITSAGVLLSYGGTIGIILFHRSISLFLSQILNKFELYKYQRKVIIIKIIDYIKDKISVSFAAQIFIAPIMLFMFNTISISFFITNFFVSLIIGPIIMFGFLFIISNLLFSKFFVSKIIQFILEKILEILIFISQVGSKLPLNKLYLATPNIWQIATFYLFIFISNIMYKIINKRNRTTFEKRLINWKNLVKHIIRKNSKKVVAIVVFMVFVLLVIKITPKDLKIHFVDQTTPNMIQRISEIFERKPLISKEI